MSALSAIPAVMAIVAMCVTAHAQISSGFNTENCTERDVARWCPSQLKKDGWALTYRSNSPENLMDVSWRYEVWMRERVAMLCLLMRARGYAATNHCVSLSEVR